ncbi:MAG TPA: GNAT family N-acetyltransferase [Longimicrobiales bacterium]|nr:GNAT family N-acetyltransferase [Longimicrobiales bacterium]
MNVRDNPEHSRFEAAVGDDVAVASYRMKDRTITFTHTEVPEALRGRGVGDALARAALDSARARGLTVVPRCPFIAAFIRRHAEYQDLVAP